MRFLTKLERKIFIYAMLLVVLSFAVSYGIFELVVSQNTDLQVPREIAFNEASVLDGLDRKGVRIVCELWHVSGVARWLESPDGKIIAGSAESGFSRSERASLPVARKFGELTIYDSGVPEAQYVAEIPVKLQEGPAVFCLYLKNTEQAATSGLFPQGLVAVFVCGVIFSLWSIWRIFRPLRKMRDELLYMADNHLEARVSENGSEEIVQVARAANSMADRLSRTIRRREELLSNISHELRSPLARMSISVAIVEDGLSALLAAQDGQGGVDADLSPHLSDKSGQPLAVKHLHSITREMDYLENLVEVCLLNNRLDLQRESPQLRPLSISELCEDMLVRYETLAAENSLDLISSIEPHLLVDGDEALLPLVISNLLDNAIKYTAPGGEIILSLREAGGQALLCLENSQDDIADDFLERLFEPFFRGQAAMRGIRGAGLGLPLTKKIIALHRGEITVQKGGLGLLFTVRLPLANIPDSSEH